MGGGGYSDIARKKSLTGCHAHCLSLGKTKHSGIDSQDRICKEEILKFGKKVFFGVDMIS